VPFVEIFVPAGSVRDDQRSHISARVTAEVITPAGLPDNDAVRAMTWLVWRDVEHWFVGGTPATTDEPPRYLVRISLAEGLLTAEKRADIVDRIVKVLAEADDDPDGFRGRPSSWIQFVEVPPDAQCLYSR
jgi:phenylpyruvate tautomerase PptA (4-oxalocrotonate tautomerase family)